MNYHKSALSGIRIVEFTLGVAAYFASKYMASLGAEVIRVESKKRLDTIRSRPAGVISKLMVGIGYETTWTNDFNLNKLGITLDLSHPEGVALAKRLVELSDVVLQNMRPGVMERLGLGYSQLREINPNLIMLSSSQAGYSGPEASYSGYAPTFSALAGLGHITGYPDGPPTEIRMPSDVISAVTSAFALVAALLHRQKTGEGQHIDLSSREALSCLIGDAFLEHSANHRNRYRHGNTDCAMAPHNCYRCRGEDKWVSIAIGSDEEWQGFCNAIGDPEWSNEERFSRSDLRWHNQEELDRLIQTWTIEHTHYEVMDTLQHAGVAAMPSLNAREICEDPHLTERGLLHDVEHPVLGKQTVFNPPWKLSATPAKITAHGPVLGEHNDYVFGELLGLSQQEINSLAEKNVFY
ncbi:CaiB/BaiF CoA transferase family protein [Chloroflexota bacterium]